MLSNGLLKER